MVEHPSTGEQFGEGATPTEPPGLIVGGQFETHLDELDSPTGFRAGMRTHSTELPVFDAQGSELTPDELETFRRVLHDLTRDEWATGPALRSSLPRVPIVEVLPNAGVDYAYRICILQATPDLFYVCLRAVGGAWGWKQFSLSDHAHAPEDLTGTDITAAELETLSDTSDADALHTHPAHAAAADPHAGYVLNAELTTHGSDVDAHHDNSNDHAQSHTAASHSDQGATGAELETLTDGSNADALHGHAVIDSIQTGKINLADTATSNTATISAVVLARSVILFNGSITTAVTNTDDQDCAVELTDTTTVTAYRGGGASSDDVDVYFTVIEFKG